MTGVTQKKQEAEPPNLHELISRLHLVMWKEMSTKIWLESNVKVLTRVISLSPCSDLCHHAAVVVAVVVISLVQRKQVASENRRPATKPRDSRNTASWWSENGLKLRWIRFFGLNHQKLGFDASKFLRRVSFFLTASITNNIRKIG